MKGGSWTYKLKSQKRNTLIATGFVIYSLNKQCYFEILKVFRNEINTAYSTSNNTFAHSLREETYAACGLDISLGESRFTFSF